MTSPGRSTRPATHRSGRVTARGTPRDLISREVHEAEVRELQARVEAAAAAEAARQAGWARDTERAVAGAGAWGAIAVVLVVRVG